jgi:hypothetical protein
VTALYLLKTICIKKDMPDFRNLAYLNIHYIYYKKKINYAGHFFNNRNNPAHACTGIDDLRVRIAFAGNEQQIFSSS